MRKSPIIAALLIAGPVMSQDEPWRAMDYGPFVSAAIEVAPDDIAGKGIAIAVGGGATMLFDTNLLRWAACWDGEVDLRGIVYDGPHGIWSRIDGEPDLHFRGPGVTGDRSFVDRRGDPYGPLPEETGVWEGLILAGDHVVMKYRAGPCAILDRPASVRSGENVVYVRTIQHGAGAEGDMLRLFELTDGQNAPDDIREVGLNDDRVCYEFRHGDTTMAFVGVVGTDATIPGRLRAGFDGVTLSLDGPVGVLEVLVAGPDLDLLSFGALTRGRAAPEPLTHLLAGGRRRWDEDVVTRGELDVRFDADERVRTIARQSGDSALTAAYTLAEGDVARPIDGELAVVIEHRGGRAPAPVASFDFDEGEGSAMRDSVTGRKSLALKGVTWRRGVRGRSLDFDGTARAIWDGALDLRQHDATIAAWISTTKDGTIVSRTRTEGAWVPGGATFFVRGGTLGFDVGWVGAIKGGTTITDGAWHHVAFTWSHDDGRIRLFLDGEPDAEGTLPIEERVAGARWQVGFTASNFPAEPWFSGYVDGLAIYDGELDEDALRAVAARTGEPLVTTLAARGATDGGAWIIGDSGISFSMPTATTDGVVRIVERRGLSSAVNDLLAYESFPSAPFAIDRITWPDDNPWSSWMRFGDFDFLDGDSIAITTWSGDVWRVDGLDHDLDELKWQRVATGLQQPLGLSVKAGSIYALGRDQITRLADLNGDGEADVYEAFCHQLLNSEHFHEPASGLRLGPDGAWYYLKAARHAKLPVHAQHGTLIRVSREGDELDIIASGFRAPCGLFVDSANVFFGSDQEGHWMPANRINRITPGSFQGNNWSGTGAPRDDYDPPLCWIHPTVDRSPSAQLRVRSQPWGELDGALLGLSYGTGKVYRILEGETVGGMAPLDIELPTGLMNGRFNPADGHLYLCGLFGWSSDKTDPGGLYRVRHAGAIPPMPKSVRAVRDGLIVEFTGALDPKSVHPDAFDIEAWNYVWSERYGSPRFALDGSGEGVTEWFVRKATLSGRTVRLTIDGFEPAMQVHVVYGLRDSEGQDVSSYMHLTVHGVE